MCTGMEVAAIVGASASAYSAVSQPKPPAAQAQAPVKPPQAAKTPDQAGIAGKNAAAAMPGGALTGNTGTFLTGPGGVDPSTLNLGRNTLLGQ